MHLQYITVARELRATQLTNIPGPQVRQNWSSNGVWSVSLFYPYNCF